MTYSPISGPPYDVYSLALGGAMAGLTARAQTSASPATYAFSAACADAWAQAFDAAWDDASPLDALQAAMIGQGSCGFWAACERLPTAGWAGPSAAPPAAGPAPSQFARAVDAIVAAITAAEDQAAAEGIALPPWRTPPASLVFRPGGVASENVFVTEASLAAATRALGGAAYVVTFDFSLQAPSGLYVLETVGPWDLAPNGTWISEGSAPTTYAPPFQTLRFAAGTTIPPGCMPTIAGFVAVEVTQGQAVYTRDLSAAHEPETYVLRDNAIVLQNAEFAGAWIATTGASYGQLFLYDNASLGDAVQVPSLTTALVNHTYVTSYDTSVLYGETINLTDGSLINYASDGKIDPSQYPIVGELRGVLQDASGLAVTTIPPGVAKGGTLISDAAHGVLYQCNAAETAWIALT